MASSNPWADEAVLHLDTTALTEAAAFAARAARYDEASAAIAAHSTGEPRALILLDFAKDAALADDGVTTNLFRAGAGRQVHVCKVTYTGNRAQFEQDACAQAALRAISDPMHARQLRGNPLVLNPRSGLPPLGDSNDFLVVGGNSGVGRDVVLQLAKLPGARVVYTYRTWSDEQRAQLEAECTQRGATCVAVRVDIGSVESIGDGVRNMRDAGYQFRAVVVCTGIGSAAVKGKPTQEKAEMLFAVNVAGPVTMSQMLIEQQCVLRHAVMLAIGSVGASDVVYPGFDALDGASKLAMDRAWRAAATDAHTWLVLKPGGIDTAMLRASTLDAIVAQDGEQALVAMFRDGWLSQSSDVASLIVALCDPAVAAALGHTSLSSHCGLNRLPLPYGSAGAHA